MPTIPSVLLRKLYQKGSLRNSEQGFEFSLKNILAPGTIVGISRLTLDGRAIDLSTIAICQGKRCIPANEISPKRPLDFGINAVVRVRAEGESLEPGLHRVSVVPNTAEVGELAIEVSDSVAAAEG